MKNKYDVNNEIEIVKMGLYNPAVEYAIGIDFDSHEANIFNIVGKASVVLSQVDKNAEAKIKEMRKRVTAANGYVNAVNIVREYINVIHYPICEQQNLVLNRKRISNKHS